MPQGENYKLAGTVTSSAAGKPPAAPAGQHDRAARPTGSRQAPRAATPRRAYLHVCHGAEF